MIKGVKGTLCHKARKPSALQLTCTFGSCQGCPRWSKKGCAAVTLLFHLLASSPSWSHWCPDPGAGVAAKGNSYWDLSSCAKPTHLLQVLTQEWDFTTSNWAHFGHLTPEGDSSYLNTMMTVRTGSGNMDSIFFHRLLRLCGYKVMLLAASKGNFVEIQNWEFSEEILISYHFPQVSTHWKQCYTALLRFWKSKDY